MNNKNHIDRPLLLCLLTIAIFGLFILYSATQYNVDVIKRQTIHLAIGFIGLLILANISPRFYKRWTPAFFMVCLISLILVAFIGVKGKGAQRWLDLGLFRFQPTELMKLALPMMMAWYLDKKPLPPKLPEVGASLGILLIPVILIAQQPDLGSAILIATSGFAVLFLAGVPWRLIFSGIFISICSIPLLWLFMHDYQKQRVKTFLNPEQDPLGSGWNIIQSKIAIGSGGVFGKGWLNGTQAQLGFLPERSTDFIFAVCSEEFGLIGVASLLALYLAITVRGLQIGSQAQDTYNRLLAGSITLTFFCYAIINIGMVSGLLPIVGLPLPLVSYGGTSLVTIMAGFGVLMSIQTHRRMF